MKMNRRRTGSSQGSSISKAAHRGTDARSRKPSLSRFEQLESRAMLSADPYQNPSNHFDVVGGSGAVTPVDAIAVINYLNKYGSQSLLTLANSSSTAGTLTASPQATSPQATAAASGASGLYLDVNGDGSVTPTDAMAVINALNAGTNFSAKISLVPTDSSGNVLSSVTVGSTFQLRAYVQDTSGNGAAGGIFSAYLNAGYSSSNGAAVTVPSDATRPVVTFGPNFTSTQEENTQTAGSILNTGAIDPSLSPTGSSKELLWFVNVTATAAGTETFTPSFTSATGDEVNEYGSNAALTASQITFVPATLTINSGTLPSTDLTVTKVDSAGGSSITGATGSVLQGGAINYTIVVTNNGPTAVTGAAILDTLPQSIASDTYTASTTTGVTGFTASGTGSIDDPKVNIPVGASVTYSIAAVVGAAVTGTISNTATVTPPINVTDTNAAHIVATDSDRVNPAADLGVTVEDSVGGSSDAPSTGTVAAGGQVVYTITVTNNGATNATGASIVDNFPAAIANDTYTATASDPSVTGFTASSSGNIDDTNVSIPAGDSITYVVTANVAATASGTLSNTATVTAGTPPDPNTSNNTATDLDTITGGPTTDLSITKVDNVGGSSIHNTAGSVGAGGQLTYTIVVTNNGSSTVTGAVIADTMPAAITSDTYTSVATGGATGFTSSSGNIDDTATMPAGSTITYTVVANVAATATGTFSNMATVAAPAGTTDSNPANNTATDTDNVVATADLSITKTDSKGGSSITATPGTVVPGTSFTYTIVVTNNGPSAVTGAKVADVMPASITNDSFSASATGGATGFTTSGTGSINDSSVNLPSGSSVTYVVTASVSPAATGTLSNTATVTAPGTVSDPNTANNSATDTDTLTPNADLSITKSDSAGGSNGLIGSVSPGATVTYTIVVSNNGPSAVTGATVTDMLPADITSDTYTATASGGATGFTASSTGNINDTSVNLPSGAKVTYVVVANVSPAATGALSNTATVTAPGGVTDPTLSNNTATDTDNLVPTADLSITKTDNAGGSSVTGKSGSVLQGGSLTYTIVVTNNGPLAANGATVVDTLPADIASDTWSATGTGGASGFTQSSSGNIDDTAVDLPAGSTVTYTVLATVSSTATGTFSNTATVANPNGLVDPVTANNTATDSDAISLPTDLSITKVDNSGGTVVPGNSVTYTIVVTNSGPNAVTGATVADSLPAGITSDTYTASPTGGATGFTASSTGNIDDTALSLPVGSSVTYTVVANVSAAATGSLSNTATVTAPAGIIDTNTANNTATVTDTLAPTADLSITKVDNKGGSSTGGLPGSVVPGAAVTYTIVVSNGGPSNVTGAAVADPLPASISSDTFTATATGGATGFTASGTGSINDQAVNLPANSTITYTVVANVLPTATGTLSNTATVTAPGGVTDPTSTNNSATDTDALVPTADLSITKVDNLGGSSITGATGSVVKGQNITYTIIVSNSGPSTVTGADIADTLPAGISSDTYTATATGGATGFTSSSSGNINDTAVTLPAGSTVTYTVVATVSATASSGTMTNTATVAAPNGVTDPTSSNNSASDADTVVVYTPSTLSGSEFIDANGNGTLDSGELAIQNATIKLTGTDLTGAAVSETTETAANGSFSFTNLKPGTYVITAVQSSYLSALKAVPGTEGGTATDAEDISVTIGSAGGVTGTGNNFTEKGFSSVGISERIFLANEALSGSVNLNNTSLFPPTASAASAVASAQAVDAAIAGGATAAASTANITPAAADYLFGQISA